MDWLLVVLFMTDTRELNQSIAERNRFMTHEDCYLNYMETKGDIDISRDNSIIKYLPKGMGYYIEWVGCMKWDKMSIIDNTKEGVN